MWNRWFGVTSVAKNLSKKYSSAGRGGWAYRTHEKRRMYRVETCQWRKNVFVLKTMHPADRSQQNHWQRLHQRL